MTPALARPFGVYVHIPFCASRCDYCDFATWTDRGAELVAAYVDACVTDVTRRYAREDFPPATSVFFGGGTPSLLPAGELVRILDAIPLAPDAEVTVECNPESADEEKLRAYRDRGVTRLSFGVQSMVPHVLRSLGRVHNPESVQRCVGMVRDLGFETFNLDLIYGASGESADDWRRSIESVLELDPPHVSAYALTVESGTPLARRIGEGECAAPDDDDQAEKYITADELFAEVGLDWYEISNWARPGNECRHNRLYWDQGEYLGIGCAAHGHTGARRWWNVRTPERYVDLVGRDMTTEAGFETLSESARSEEAITLSLRTRSGVVAHRDRAKRSRIVEEGLATWESENLVLTRRGRLLANDATARLLAAGDAVCGLVPTG